MKYLYRSFLFVIAILFLLTLCSTSVYSQISLAPTILTIHDNTNVGSIYINNNSSEPKEVSISLEFGYPGSDSLGNLEMNYEDSLAAGRYGLGGNVRVFPRNFVVNPNEQQTVRLQVLPDAEQQDGTYWTRVRVTSNTITPDVEERTTEGITARINYRFEQNIAAFYYKGDTTTGVEVNEISVEEQDNELIVIPSLTRTGNSPFLGSMYAELYNQSGELVREAQATTTVYFNEKRRIVLSADELPSGIYSLQLHFETSRGDVSAGDIPQAPRITETRTVEL